MNSPYSILLASGSPRRRELLRQLPIQFKVAPADIDESACASESPKDYVQRMAIEKALAGFLKDGGEVPSMGADTIVLLDGEILGKPVSREDAVTMLQRLSGRTHEVYSAVAVALATDRIIDTLNITAVTFGSMTKDWIAKYCQTDEPMDKAGAYAVQGDTGRFISRIEGSYTGVMGLPLYETARLLQKAGLL